MHLKTTRVGVWAAEIDDLPGSLARILRAIAEFGVDLSQVIARRQPEKPGKGLALVITALGNEHLETIADVSLHRANGFAVLKIEGADEHGAGARIAKTIADVGVNVNSLSASVIGHRFVCYAIFEHLHDLEIAEKALAALNTPAWWPWHRDPSHRAA